MSLCRRGYGTWLAYKEEHHEHAVAHANPIDAAPGGVALSRGTAEVGKHVAEQPGRDEGRDDEAERPEVDLARLEVEREQVCHRPQSHALGRGLEESLEDTHRGEDVERGSDGTADGEAKTKNLRPEENGEAAVTLDEEDGDDSTGACQGGVD